MTIPWNIAVQTTRLRYFLAILTVVLVSFSLAQIGELISEDNEMLLYLSGLIFCALYLGRGPSRAAAVTSLFILNVGHIHPGFRIGFHKFQYALSFAIFLVVSDQIARLADGVRVEAWQARALYHFSVECAHLNDPDEVLRLLGERCAAYGVSLEYSRTDNGGQPLQTPRAVYGWTLPALKDNLLLESLRAQAALALERIQQSERSRQASVLEATQKMQSALINSISHDLQTPLSSIRGSIETLRNQGLAAEDRCELIQTASDQTRRLQKLVKNILNLSKLDGGGLTLSVDWVCPKQLVQSVIETFPRESRTRLKIRCQQELPEVQGDSALLSQVLANLIDNALKFSTASVAVEARLSDRLTLLVQDEGMGVAAEDEPHIFERFYRGKTPRRVSGSGLGLHICRAIAEIHGGSVHFQRRQPRGSCFGLSLPITVEVGHV